MGRKGLLLGSATTMALPPAAAAELLHAYGQPVPDGTATQAECQASLRELMSDYALCWHLMDSFSAPVSAGGISPAAHTRTVQNADSTVCRQLMSAAAETAAETAASVLEHLDACNMGACRALLSARCIVAAAAMTAPTPVLAARALLEAPLAVLLSGNSAVGQASTIPLTASAAMSDAVTPCEYPLTPSPSPLPAAAAEWCPRSRGVASSLATPTGGPEYAAWKARQRERIDRVGAAVMMGMGTVTALVLIKRMRSDQGLCLHWFLEALIVLLHTLLAVVPHVMPALGPPGMARRRGALALGQALARAAVFTAAAMCLLPLPGRFREILSIAPTMPRNPWSVPHR